MIETAQNMRVASGPEVNPKITENLSEVILEKCFLRGEVKTLGQLFYNLKKDPRASEVLSRVVSVRRYLHWIEVDSNINPDLLSASLVQMVCGTNTTYEAKANCEALRNPCVRDFDLMVYKIEHFVTNFVNEFRSRYFILFVQPESWLKNSQLSDEEEKDLTSLIDCLYEKFCGLIVTNSSSEAQIKENLERQDCDVSKIKLVISDAFYHELNDWLRQDDVRQKLGRLNFDDDVIIFCALRLHQKVEVFDYNLPIIFRPGGKSLPAYYQALNCVKVAFEALITEASSLQRNLA